MDDGTLPDHLIPGETYQIDSDEYDSDNDDGGPIAEEEFDDLIAEGKSSDQSRNAFGFLLI